MVLVILAALWAIVLLPPLLRSRAERTSDSIGDFNHRLTVLSRTNGPAVNASSPRLRRRPHAAQRRREVLRVLLVSICVTGLAAMATDAKLAWLAFAASAVALAAFCALWAWARSVQAERHAKVRTMPQRRPAGDYSLRRVASS